MAARERDDARRMERRIPASLRIAAPGTRHLQRTGRRPRGDGCGGPRVASAQPRQPSASASGMCSRGLMGSVEGTGTARSDVA